MIIYFRENCEFSENISGFKKNLTEIRKNEAYKVILLASMINKFILNADCIDVVEIDFFNPRIIKFCGIFI
jgi:hypothetical protein